ncbi:unnamed protein product [Caenorhabditis auriculariae]|uniref:Uncharacterized protein n=1 Tax=Caenorhabditis auriculariae TaxID=2777116 RepID=A0A8S1H6M4_9PELO|nr:unnamed protein product [Caenorhabditis auriculariae]
MIWLQNSTAPQTDSTRHAPVAQLPLAHVPAAQASATPHPPVVNSASGDQRGLDALSDRELWAAVARASSSTTFLEKSFRAVLEKLADSKNAPTRN